jgi:hypothetical protein
MMLTSLLLAMALRAVAVAVVVPDYVAVDADGRECKIKIGTCGGGDFALSFGDCACDCLYKTCRGVRHQFLPGASLIGAC